MRRKSTHVWRLTALVLCMAVSVAAGEKPKNIIVMIADGTGSQQYTFARWWKGEPLQIEKYLVGSLRTFIADSVVADSAPAATALATGVRTSDKLIGIGPVGTGLLPGESVYNGEPNHPLATVLEGAKLLGKATGVVATCRISHATPAGYYAHTNNRNFENDITEMGVYSNIDVMLGGGGRHLLPMAAKGKREDGENLEQVLLDRGYSLVKTADQLRAITSGRVWGAFAANHMEPEIDRLAVAPSQPTVAEMTGKAIELLSQNQAGFFLMVEGSQVDWANHANDPAYAVTDLVAWDDACKVAVDFAQQRGDTLVLMLSDHDTGGFTIGNYRTDNTYSQMKLDQLLEPIRNISMSTTRMASMLAKASSIENVQAIVKQGWHVDLSYTDARRILELASFYKEDVNWAFGEVLSAAYTNIGWSTHGHVGGDVPIGAFGPGKPEGMYDEPGFGQMCADLLGLDMEKLTQRLFVDSAQVFAGGVTDLRPLTQDGVDKPVDYALEVECNGKKAVFRTNKNIVVVDGVEHQLEGVAYYNLGNGKFYIPAQAVGLISGANSALPTMQK